MFGDSSNQNYTFVNITSVGTFAIRAESADEKRFGLTPTKREYTAKNGEVRVVYEFSTTDLSGTLLKANIRHTDFGDNITLNIKSKDSKGNVYHFSIGASAGSSYGRQLMERLPSLRPGDNIKLNVWDNFTSKEGKNIRAGIKITNLNTGEAVRSYFWDNEAKKPLYGYPEMKPNMNDDQWKLFFLEATIFLKEYIRKNVEPLYEHDEERDLYGDLPETGVDDAKRTLTDEFELIDNPFAEGETGQEDDLPF